MSESKKKQSQQEVPVVVTTEHRGVFFGYVDEKQIDGEILVLKRARLCVRWSQAVRGFVGLAANGPTKTCRIGPQAPEIRLRKITAALRASDAAVKAWEAAPWSD